METRYTECIDHCWKFQKLSADGPLLRQSVETDCNDESWETIALPHTWNAGDCCGGLTKSAENGERYYRGTGCYRRHFFFPGSRFALKRIFLSFEGANTVTEVFINGLFAGRHEGGYAAFRFDITDLVRLDQDNVIAVTVSNAPTERIAPINIQGDFTKMGGLYRSVFLIACSPVHIDLLDYGSSGIYLTPCRITPDRADVAVTVRLANDLPEERQIDVSVAIYDSDGHVVSQSCCDAPSSPPQKASSFSEAPGTKSPAAQNTAACAVLGRTRTQTSFLLPLSHPVLWDGVRSPYLYHASVTLSCEGTVCDSHTEYFGVRSYYIDAENGFFLNGAYTDLHGVNYHQDSFEGGWAMTDSQRERDYRMMLELGCNCVRMAHYQHHPFEYELCDKLGIVVWTELGIINTMSKDREAPFEIAEGFTENARQQLTELIRQNYNHPSVIVWGISNELYQMSDEIYQICQELHALAKQEDASRLTTFADSQFYGRFLTLPGDVVGYNRYFGWYQDAGPAEQFGEWLDTWHTEKEPRPLCISEYGGGGAISQHKDNIDWQAEIDPWGKRHYENYQSLMHEKIWAQFCTRRYLWAKFVWCMFDFASAGRTEGDTCGQNDKGLCTRDRVRKDAFYFYQSVWNYAPMLHLTEKRFTDRPTPVPLVKAYSNVARCELTVNGASCGMIQKSSLPPEADTVFTWKNVRLLSETANTVTVTAYFDSGAVTEDSACWRGV